MDQVISTEQDEFLLTLRKPVLFGRWLLFITGAFAGYLVRAMWTWHYLYGDALKKEKDREVEESVRRGEMDLATNIQRAALPASLPVMTGLDIATVSEFPLDVGGDFYLFLQDGHRLVVAVGDVSGKGISAALTATSISHLLPWLHPLDDPSQALRDLNRDLVERLPPAAFVTLVLAEINMERETLCVWNAGHPPALLLCADCGDVISSMAEGPLLGVMSHWSGQPWSAPFHAGDALLLYTDGLTEARRGRSEEFGVENIADALQANSSLPATRIARAIAGGAKSWGTVFDDLTIVVCRRPASPC